jgi:hypothetical protein
MKRFLSIFLFIVLPYSFLHCQAPESFIYQIILSDQDGSVISEKEVRIKVELLEGSENGKLIYSEIHNKLTGRFGLVSIAVGSGLVNTGDFTAINWGFNRVYIRISINADGSGIFYHQLTSQLQSVPYAIYSNESASATKSQGDAWTTIAYNTYIESPYALVGIGTIAPDKLFHVKGFTPSLKSEDQDGPGSSVLRDAYSNSWSTLFITKSSQGNTQISIDPLPTDGTSAGIFRFFRSTNTTGNVGFYIHKGDGSSTINSLLGGNGDSYFNNDSGNLGIGVSNP